MPQALRRRLVIVAASMSLRFKVYPSP